MKKYGRTYKLSDFIARIISEDGTNAAFALAVLSLLKDLDAVQITNPLFTTSVHAGGGLSALWRGETLFSIWPAKRHLRLFWHHQSSQSRKLAKILDVAQKKGIVGRYIDQSHNHDRRGWLISASGLKFVREFVANLPKPSASEMKRQNTSHPRYFSGEVRQIALDRFLENGRYCPGIGPTKRHKVEDGERVEFDHILPHALGGSNSEINVQVLCQPCNNKKRATALGNATISVKTGRSSDIKTSAKAVRAT